MSQEEINEDLGGYLHERKDRPFWKNFKSKSRPKASNVQEELKVDVKRVADREEKNIAPENKKELEAIEEKIEEVNKIETDTESYIEKEHESLLRRFFKRLNFSEKDADERIEEDIGTKEASEEEIKTVQAEKAGYNKEELVMNDSELREMLHGLHEWLAQLPPEKLAEFKQSKDFELYTQYLKKHNLIR